MYTNTDLLLEKIIENLPRVFTLECLVSNVYGGDFDELVEKSGKVNELVKENEMLKGEVSKIKNEIEKKNETISELNHKLVSAKKKLAKKKSKNGFF